MINVKSYIKKLFEFLIDIRDNIENIYSIEKIKEDYQIIKKFLKTISEKIYYKLKIYINILKKKINERFE
jgi:hypothetical protein